MDTSKEAADALFEYLRYLIYEPSKASLDAERLPGEFQDLGRGLQYYAQCTTEAFALARDLAKGDLHTKPISSGNDLAHDLKALQSSLTHLTWQVGQVAKGDYKQRVSFMGEFSDVLNNMIEQLDEQRSAISAEMEVSRQRTQALLQSNSLFEIITENISQWIIMIDLVSSEWLFSNHQVKNMLANLETEPQLHKWLNRQLIRHQRSGDVPEGQLAVPQPTSTTGGDPLEQSSEIALDHPNGSQYYGVLLYPISWHEHDAMAFVLTDITAEKKKLDKLATLAYHDTLTGTFNRHYGMNVLNDWLAQCADFMICFIDMDNLKYVNDTFGHSEGDLYILAVCGILKQFADDSIVCRLGGDEFMLLAKNWEAAAAEQRLEELRSELIKMSNNPDAFYNRSMSYGIIAVDDTNTLPAGELLSAADEKMYEYKKARKMERKAAADAGI
ncbi:MAG: GGDEF domain-containing protein [Coriobacteriales bacterium]|nr:GGDEF domain-containing protein [Coriobacteriales bacterium]